MTFPAWPDATWNELEEQLLSRWRDEGLFERTQEQTRNGRPFVFYEGPPTANGRPGIHHVFARSIKDLVCRFRAMQGRQVTRIAGWDTHGLPVEIEVEKELQLDGKKAIEAYGVGKFNAKARESVFRYQKEWEDLSNRIGYWLDYQRPYVTCSNEYVESVWWLLKRLHEKDMLYRGHRVLPYCPRCGTVLSSHELALGYQDDEDPAVTVRFPLANEDRILLVWTTTPWTLLANQAVGINSDLQYAEYEVEGKRYVVASARGEALFPGHAAARAFSGTELLGLRYRPPFDPAVGWATPGNRDAYTVIQFDHVTADSGTGVVHLAPSFGKEDYEAVVKAREAGLRIGLDNTPVGLDGRFRGLAGLWPELNGLLVTDPDTNKLIIRELKARQLRFDQQIYKHSYPHCWRCKSKLIYYARDSWFVRTSAVKQRMLDINREVHWHPPEVGAGRFGEWLENNVDWALSRDRYWGTPLPVWVSDQDPKHVEVIGSYEELARRSGRTLGADFDPHKPGIDDFTWPAPGGGTMRRTPEVIDTWFDSGAMPYAQWHYPFEHQGEFTAHFPADFICEGVDQTRGWFYSLLAIATTVFDSPAYRNVVVNELVLDADGQKMSKSRGNVADPWAAIREFGADTVRLYLLASSQVWATRRFDARGIAEQGGFLRTLRDTYRFFSLYAGSAPPAYPATRLPALDRWILARLDALVEDVTAAWEGYQVTDGVRRITAFVVDDLSNWYVRQSRARFWAPGREADPAAVATLHEALVTVARLLAPAAPFASDWLHRALTGASVHLSGFPAPGARRDARLEGAMDAVRRLASLARAARETRNIRVRQPLAAMQVALPAGVDAAAFEALVGLLQREVNVQAVSRVATDADLVRLRAKPNFRALGKRFGKQTQEAAAAVQALDTAALRAIEAGQGVSLGGLGEVSIAEVEVEREVTSDWLVLSEGQYVVALDPHITDALRAEGLAREVVSKVQRMRKDAGYEYTDRIRLWVSGSAVVEQAVQQHAGFIAEETLAQSLGVGERAGSADMEQQLELDGVTALVAVRRDTGT